jgi:hypothetical protein
MSRPGLRSLPPEARPHVAAAGRVLAQATALLNKMTPDEIAEAAYTPGGPSKEQLKHLAEARLLGRRSQDQRVAS